MALIPTSYVILLALVSLGQREGFNPVQGNDEFWGAVKEDWCRQENRLGRRAGDRKSIETALRKAEQLVARLETSEEAWSYRRHLRQLLLQAARVDLKGAYPDKGLYFKIRGFVRELALRNPLFPNTPLLFMQRRRFICQMLHEYLGYYYDYGDIEGGGIYILKNPGASFEVEDLIQGRLPKGNYTTLALSYDAQTIYFAFASRAPEKPDFYSSERRCFHLYAMNADGSNLRQLTDGPADDFDPCPLPDGGLAFISTRRGGFTRCNNPWEPLPAHTLHRLNPDGTILPLSVHETSEWHPKVLHDGRIVYIRWDYVDRSAAHFHGLWTTNPDGTNARQLFGNYTQRINACYQPQSIPGSKRLAFLAGAHHANVGGSLVLFDPARACLNPDTGEDELLSIEVLTPEVCFPEAPNDWPRSYYHSPWPLSEDCFLISASMDPLPGMSAITTEDTETGIYWFDRTGIVELLFRKNGISSMYPIPLTPRSTPPVIPSTLNSQWGNSGIVMLSNVYKSHLPFPQNRKIVALHVYQLLPKSETHVANQPRLGYANAESARMLLGSVPVEEDGSAHFWIPALKPLAFQAIDERGRAVQGMRSAVYLQPGECRSCIGCHESPEHSGSIHDTPPAAFRRNPSAILPGPDGTYPWNFRRLVEPIIQTHCVRCHEGEGTAQPRLGNGVQESFTEAYLALKPFVRWYEWGDKSISEIVTRPGEMPSDKSPLISLLRDEVHSKEVQLSDNEWRALYVWLDGNAAFYGAYSQEERAAQLAGMSIQPPALQ